MVKMMFMLYWKEGLTREQCVAEWTGPAAPAVVPR